MTFIGHTKDSLWSVALFRCESIALKTRWVMAVMDQFTRKIVGFAVHPGVVGGVAACRMFRRAVSKRGLPRSLSSDHDPLFAFHRWHANLGVLGIDEIKSVPGLPWSHPFVERLIGTVRREHLDRTVFRGAVDLERMLTRFQDYFNDHRVHSSLGGKTPAEASGGGKSRHAELEPYHWVSHCQGLVQLPAAA